MKHLATITLIALAGCSTVQVTEKNLVTEKVGQLPSLGTQGSTPVGGVVFSQFRYWSKVAYRLDVPVNVSLMLGRVVVAQGDFLVPALIDGKSALCTEKRAYVDLVVGPHAIACFFDLAANGTFTRMSAAPGVVWIEKDLPTPARYSKSELTSPRADSFKYEILYQGISNKAVRLSYREFVNDLARPAYFQDVSYDIAMFPATITFRTVRIEVLSADNNSLVYRVLSGF